MPIVRPDKPEIGVRFVGEDNVSPVADKIQSKLSGGFNKSAFAGGFFGGVVGTAVFSAVVSGLEMIKDGYNDIVDLAKESPELFTDDQLRNLENADKSLQMLKNSWQELKIEIASGIAPAIEKGVDHMLDFSRAQELALEEGKIFRYLSVEQQDAFLGIAAAEREAEQATMSWADTQDDAAKVQKEFNKALNEAIKTQNTYYKGQISTLGKLKSMREGEVQDAENIADKRQQIQDEIIRENIAYSGLVNGINWVRQANGKLKQERGPTIAQISDHVVKIKELEGALADLTVKESDLARQSQETKNQMVFDLLQERLAADGVTTSAEYLYELQVGKQLGLFSQEDVKTLQDINQAANDFASGAPEALSATEAAFLNIKQPMQDVKDLMDKMAAYDGRIINFGVNFWSSGGVSTPSTNAINNASSFDRALINRNWNYAAQEINRRLVP